MNRGYPVYTADAECQDCFKCVRQCPVKAIRVEDGHASVIPELCVACGECVQVCPVHAKKIRDDLGRVRLLLQGAAALPVYVSLAPSWVNEFPGLSAGKMVAALKKTGFTGVSETALGAQIVSQETAKLLKDSPGGLLISSACPVAVDFIRKYDPALAERISPVLSPALSHARFLKKEFGEKISVVFVGPCIAKKNESDRHPELISAALLYSSLKRLFRESNVNPWEMIPEENDSFVPFAAKEGALYPIEGGMNETIRRRGTGLDVHFAFISGLEPLRQAISGCTPDQVKEKMFLEILACPGGCVHGPGTEHDSPGLLERLRVLRNVHAPRNGATEMDVLQIKENYNGTPVRKKEFSPAEIRKALTTVGKTSPEQELNCGGCGYFTCRNFAVALLEGKAEPCMCVSYMRQLAQKKSNAIMRCMPAGVVIVDNRLNVIECNRKFAELAGPDALEVYETINGMAGAELARLVPYARLFRHVLETGEEYASDAMRAGDRLLSIRIFNIEPEEVAGGILFDVTNLELRREQIAERAQEVIKKNLLTVQEIACKLGEHMAETEILLRSIAEKYSGQEPNPDDDLVMPPEENRP